MCTVNGNGGDTMGATFTAQASGSCRVTANKVGNDNYNAAPQVTSSITVNKASQAITGFNPPATISQSAGSTLTLTATGGASGNPVTFSTTTPSVCTTGGTNGVTLTVRSAGNCSVTANQAGNDNYSAALPVTVTISIAVPAQLYFIHADHLGTPRAITKASDNTKVWEWKNDDPFGNNIPDENPNGANTSAFKYNLRFLGQYFDEETNTHYNYFRDYEPSTGRYVQSDPIGLNGGMNSYGYVEGDPVANVDPLGLQTYRCMRPLKGTPGKQRRNVVDVPGNFAWHRYTCVTDRDPKGVGFVCGGQGPRDDGLANFLHGPGKPTDPRKDYFHPDACEKVREEDTCYEKCIRDEWAKPRPNYGWPGLGTDCKEYDDNLHRVCRVQCGQKSPSETK